MYDRDTANILNAIMYIWIRMSDLKPKGKAYAHMIERHHALLRYALHHIDGLMMRNGSAVPLQAILDEALLIKNCLVSIQGAG
jgi:hypothetical protein